VREEGKEGGRTGGGRTGGKVGEEPGGFDLQTWLGVVKENDDL